MASRLQRSPIQRKTKIAPGGYLKRHTPLKPASKKKIAEKRAKLGLADEAYLQWVRTLPCCVCPLDDRTQAHHLKHGRGERRGGMGIRVHDRLTVPMCSRHHRQFHAGTGFFQGWDKERKRVWQEAWIARLHKKFCSTEKRPIADRLSTWTSDCAFSIAPPWFAKGGRFGYSQVQGHWN